MAACKVALFTAAHGQLFRSPDAGETWKSVFTGYVSAVDSSDTTAFLGSSQGMYRSTDGGQTWTPAGLAGQYVTALKALDAAVFAGTSSAGLYRSTDAGDTWTPVLQPGGWIYHIAGDESRLFAGVSGGGIYRSTDGGEHWEPVDAPAGMGTGLATSGQTVLASVLYPSAIHRSTDGGDHWEVVPGTESLAPEDVDLDQEQAFACGDGVYRSLDGGQTWEGLATHWHNIGALAVSYPRLYASTAGRGLYASADGGLSWSKLSLSDDGISDLALSPYALFAASYTEGLFRSQDGGATWARVLDEAVAVVSARGHSVLAGTFAGVHFSPDDGATWRAGLSGRYVWQVDLWDTAAFAATTDDGLFRSRDGGQTWERAGFAGKTVSALATAGGQVWVAGSMGGGVWASDDDGQTWLPAGLQEQGILHLAADGTRLFAYDGLQVYWSKPGGSWAALPGHPTAWGVATMEASAHRLYLGTAGNGVWARELPQLQVESSALHIRLRPDDLDVLAQDLAIRNTGTGRLDWVASTSGQSWLGITPASGQAPAPLHVTVDKAGLTTGVYTGTITIAGADDTAYSPQRIPVTLSVQEGSTVYLPCLRTH